MINNEQLKELAKQIYENACKHGWHEESKPDGLWMALVMSEVAEAIEADRKSAHADVPYFLDHPLQFDGAFKACYESYIKGSVEEELADVVIRLLDFINMRWGDYYSWWYSPSNFRIPDDFAVAAWHLVKDILNTGSMNVRDSIQYVLEWSDKLNINIMQFIEWKMRYNSMRPYKHGGKKY